MSVSSQEADHRRAQLEELLSQAPEPLCLRRAELNFLDSSGVAVLIRIADHFGQVRTVQATEPVGRVLTVLGLSDRLKLDELLDGDGDRRDQPDLSLVGALRARGPAVSSPT